MARSTPIAGGQATAVAEQWGDTVVTDALSPSPKAFRATMATALVYCVGPEKAARQLGHVGPARCLHITFSEGRMWMKSTSGQWSNTPLGASRGGIH